MDQDYHFNFRLKAEYQKAIKKYCNKHHVEFDSIGHFCRVAVIRLAREKGVIDEAGRVCKN